MSALAEEATRRSIGDASGHSGGGVGGAGASVDGVASGEVEGEAPALACRKPVRLRLNHGA
eukprot:6111444-Pleurochrysis_carterae.AAC.2